MKKERKEIQSLNLLHKIMKGSQIKKAEEEKKRILQEVISVKKKSIGDMSKNVMSVLLPYNTQMEINRFEQTNKKMLLFSNFWPVWKNIYCDFHLPNTAIPADTKSLTEEEQENRDYRAACKRCYLYVKDNTEEVIPDHLLDYKRGF